MNNQRSMIRPTPTDLNLDELHYYPLIISINRCYRNCNTVQDPFGRICVPNKIEDLNLKIFNMIRGINVNVDVNLMVENNSRKKWNSDKCQKSPSDINYQFIVVVLLAITILLLLMVVVFKYNMKRGLTIPCLLSYHVIIENSDEYYKRNQYKKLLVLFFE